MANETASFTLRFRNEVSRPASRAAEDLNKVRSTLVRLGAAGPESALSMKRAAVAHETASQRMARESRRNTRRVAREQARTQRAMTAADPLGRMDAAMEHERWGSAQREIRQAKKLAGAMHRMAEAMAHERWGAEQRQMRKSARLSEAMRRMDAAMERERWVALKRQQRAERDLKVLLDRKAVAGQHWNFSLAAAGAGANVVAAAIAGIAVAAGAAAVAIGVLSAKFAAASIDAMKFGQQSELALTYLLGRNAAKARQEFDEVRRLAQELGLDVRSTVHDFQKLLAAQFEVGQAKELIKMGADLQGIGASAEQVSRALLAITQIKSKGRLMAEEMLQLQEAGISSELVYESLGKRLGKTREELRQLQEAGKIDAVVGLQAIQDAVKKKTGVSEAGELGRLFATSTLAGMQAQLAGRIENFFIDIGRRIEPIVMPIARRLFATFEKFESNDKLRALGDRLLFGLERFGNWVVNNWPQIEGYLVRGFELIVGAVDLMASGVGLLITYWEPIKTTLVGLGLVVGALVGMVLVAGAIMIAPLYAVIAAVGFVIGALAQGIGWIASRVSDWVELGKNLVMGLVRGMLGAFGPVIDAVTWVVGSAIKKAKSLLDLGSPSKLFRGFGEDTVQGYVIGVETRAERAERATGAIAGHAALPFVGRTGTPANDIGRTTLPAPSIQPAPIFQGSTAPQAVAAAVNAGGITVNINLNLPPGMTAEAGQELGEVIRPVVRREVQSAIEYLALTGT